MQQEFDDAGIAIQIIGLNQFGYEIGNPSITEERNLPWLQDTEEIDAWTIWDVTYRDVHILDQDHNLRYIYNLSTNNLKDADKFQELSLIMEGLLP